MLLEFTVSNFRSFREPQTLSMAANSRLQRKENAVRLETNERLPAFLKAAVIYGPNASGKSALYRALTTVPIILRRKPEAAASPLPVWPFRFDKMLQDQPSRFEYHFVHEGVRYYFEVELNSERVVLERLSQFPNGKEQLLYRRSFISEKYSYDFGSELEGGREIHKAWAGLTNPRSLFLSQAVANSSEDLIQLKKPMDWFLRMRYVDSRTGLNWARSVDGLLVDEPNYHESVSEFLSNFDIPIVGMRLQEVVGSDLSSSEEVETSVKKKTIYIHRSALGDAEFPLNDESDGTKNLLGFWAPWTMATMAGGDSLCSVLVIDEMDSSLHPKIVENLVRAHLANDREVQLIFTTHDTHLMNARLLRRDQIWIMERDENASSQLRSIHDFSGREGEDIEKRYYEGRYRGLPILKRG